MLFLLLSPGMCGKVDRTASKLTGPGGSEEYNVKNPLELKRFVRAWQVADADSLLFGVSATEKTKLDWPTWCECSANGKTECKPNFDVETCTPYKKRGNMLSIENLSTVL